MTLLDLILNGHRLEAKYANSPRPGQAQNFPEYEVETRVLTTAFKGSEENRSGADIMFSFSAELDGKEIKKSALIQAKLYKSEDEFFEFPSDTAGRKQLLAQCRRMEKISKLHSYVFIYSQEGIIFFSAESITKGIVREARGLSFNDGLFLEEFVGELFECKIGDHNLPIMNTEEFHERLTELEIGEGFMIEVKDL